MHDPGRPRCIPRRRSARLRLLQGVAMHRLSVAIAVSVLSCAAWGEQAADAGGHAWVAHSNAYTNKLLEVQFAHDPERGSRQGLAQFDELISNPTLADEMVERHELEKVLAGLDAARRTVTDKKVQEDLDILHKA